MATQKQQGIKKQLTKGFVKVAIIGAIAAVIGIVVLLIAAMQYEKALSQYGFTQGDIGKAVAAFSESRSALRAVVGYDDKAVIDKQIELHDQKKEAFETYIDELNRSIKFTEGRDAYNKVKMSTLNSTFFHVFIVLPFCTIRSLFYCIFSLLGSAIVRLPLLPASHAPYFRSYASCFTSSSNSSPAE